MGCTKCKKKGIPIECNYCPGKYCSRCINLDEHSCLGKHIKQENEIKNLEKKLITVRAAKVSEI